MQNAETVWTILRERGRRQLPLEGLYRQLFNPDLYLRAYGRIYRNVGAMTRGITEETPDGMSLDKINALIEKVRFERYAWTPVRRIHIPKSNGTTRPLGIPTWSDKLLQEVIRSLLEAYYEPQFSDQSHGFRPERGCHTALQTIQRNWTGTKWFIEGDIRGCFDNIDHQTLLSILREKIHDNRFLRLIENLLKAGYLEHWKYNATLSGTPQGGILSPLLSNICLDRLDRFVWDTLLPEYNRGNERRENRAYSALVKRAYHCRKTGRPEEAKECTKRFQSLPSRDPDDPTFRRLHYVRYADDFLLGFAGPKAEAQEIKDKLRAFLSEHLRLELSEDKTLITHAQTQKARFLGYELVGQHCDTKHDANGRRAINARIALRVPAAVVEKNCAKYMRGGKPVARAELLQEDDFTIVNTYQFEYRGLVQYYLLATNVSWFSKLRWVMETSLLKTLADKHQTSVAKTARKLSATVRTPHGLRKCLVVWLPRNSNSKEPLRAQFGGIALRRSDRAAIADLSPGRWKPTRSQLEKRLLAEVCEICGSTDKVEVHHIRKLADLRVKGQREKPLWMQIMASRQRKTLVVCLGCHADIHAGRPLKSAPR